MKKIFAITLIVLVCAMLFACTQPTERQQTAEEKLTALLDGFLAENEHKITGVIFKNNEKLTEIKASANRKEKKIAVNYCDTEYMYYARYLLKKTDGYIIEKSNTSYAATAESFLPFFIENFVYNPAQRNEIYLTGNQIIVTFLNTGVKNSFSSSLDIGGGVLTVTEKDGRIVSSTLSTIVTENKLSYPLYVRYEYQTCDNIFDALPQIKPRATISYASYAMSNLSTVHSDKTIRTTAGKDTEIKLEHFKIDAATVKEVNVQTVEDNITLVVDFSSPQSVSATLGSLALTVKKLEITYSEKFEFINLRINDTKYYLK